MYDAGVQSAWFSLPADTMIQQQDEVPFTQRIAGEGERSQISGINTNAQFLTQFARKRMLGCLARLDLAARKFPQACHYGSCGALLDKHPARTIAEHCRHDRKKCRIYFHVVCQV